MVVRLFFALLLLCSASAWAAPTTPGKEEYTRALEHSKKREFKEALVLFRQAYELSNHRPSTIVALAQCERELGNYDEALQLFRQYTKIVPRPRDAATVERTITRVEEERALVLAAAPTQASTVAAARDALVMAPQPLPAAPAVVPSVSVETDDQMSLLSHPATWIIAIVAIVGGGVTLALLTRSEADRYGGTTGVVIEKLELER